MIHSNSLSAYQTEKARLNSREMEILLWFNSHPGAYTDRKIQELMGFASRSDVQPRISTLIKKGLLYQSCTARCHITGKRVRAVRITNHGHDVLFAMGKVCRCISTPSGGKDFIYVTGQVNRSVIPKTGQCLLFK